MKNIKFTFSVLLFVVYCAYGIAGSKDAKPRTTSQDLKKKSETYSTGRRVSNLVQYAKPIYGTGKDGNTYPGPSLPFGMIQWSPDTGPGKVVGGYNYRM